MDSSKKLKRSQISCKNFREIGLNKKHFWRDLLDSIKVTIRNFFSLEYRRQKKKKLSDGELHSIPCKNVTRKDLDNLGRKSLTRLPTYYVRTKPNGPVVVVPGASPRTMREQYPNGEIVEPEIKEE